MQFFGDVQEYPSVSRGALAGVAKVLLLFLLVRFFHTSCTLINHPFAVRKSDLKVCQNHQNNTVLATRW